MAAVTAMPTVPRISTRASIGYQMHWLSIMLLIIFAVYAMLNDIFKAVERHTYPSMSLQSSAFVHSNISDCTQKRGWIYFRNW